MYQYKEKYTLNFTNVQSYLDMHFIIRRELDLPDYYGCNWDAFWDCLTEMYGEDNHIEIIGIDVIERKFDDAADKMLSILRRFKQNNPFPEDDIQIVVVRGDERIVLS